MIFFLILEMGHVHKHALLNYFFKYTHDDFAVICGDDSENQLFEFVFSFVIS